MLPLKKDEFAEEVSKHLATKEKLNETKASHAAVLDTLELEKSSHNMIKNELSKNRVSFRGMKYLCQMDWSSKSYTARWDLTSSSVI